jgi:putative peptidoglycan lipid II flippase
LAQVGLALATSIGAWINLVLVIWLASRAGLITLDPDLRRSLLKIAAAGLLLAGALWFGDAATARLSQDWAPFRDESRLALLVLIGAVVYGGVLLALFGRKWLAILRGPPLS